jgi:hypothetical protein
MVCRSYREWRGLWLYRLVILSMASVFNHMTIGALVAFYYICTFADMCHYMNLPLLSCARNVYCDGVYDLCHVGHKNAYRCAMDSLTLGDPLLYIVPCQPLG